MGKRKQIIGVSFLVLLVAGISCGHVPLFLYLCCSSTSELDHLSDLLDCSLLPGAGAFFFILFGLIPLLFLPPAYLIPHLSEFIDSLYKPPRLVPSFL